MTIWLAAALLVSATACTAVLGCLAYIVTSLRQAAPLIASRRGRQPLTALLVRQRTSPPQRRTKARATITLTRPRGTLQPAFARVRMR
jgi:hypothetical protein